MMNMPEAMIIYRFYFEGIGMTDKWWNDYTSLSNNEKNIINQIIENNDFHDLEYKTNNKNVLSVLQYYTITRDDAEKAIKQNKNI